MPDEAKDPEKKLFVDEDWKSQVEAEKEAARRAQESRAEKPAQPQPSSDEQGPLPPADLTFLVSSLYLQGTMALGVLPNPATNKADVHLDQAKHVIDMLAMLEQKTEGNRTAEESDGLEAALHELRLAYVSISEASGAKS